MFLGQWANDLFPRKSGGVQPRAMQQDHRGAAFTGKQIVNMQAIYIEPAAMNLCWYYRFPLSSLRQ